MRSAPLCTASSSSSTTEKDNVESARNASEGLTASSGTTPAAQIPGKAEVPASVLGTPLPNDEKQTSPDDALAALKKKMGTP